MCRKVSNKAIVYWSLTWTLNEHEIIVAANATAKIIYFILLEITESNGSSQGELHNAIDDSFMKKSVAKFDYQLPQNVSAIVGKTAFLTCVVKNLKPSQKVLLFFGYLTQ